jgi:hypothetical protein
MLLLLLVRLILVAIAIANVRHGEPALPERLDRLPALFDNSQQNLRILGCLPECLSQLRVFLLEFLGVLRVPHC